MEAGLRIRIRSYSVFCLDPDPYPIYPERFDPDPVCPERLDPEPVNNRPDPQPWMEGRIDGAAISYTKVSVIEMHLSNNN